nr:unnamed protein product [Callosobruchus analis]
MWEKAREDGTRKLKANAVPTVFSFSQPKKPRKPPAKRKLSSLKEVKVMTDGAIQVADIAQEDTTTATTANITCDSLAQPSTSTAAPPTTQSFSPTSGKKESCVQV